MSPQERAIAIGGAFTPAAPVQVPDLFAGRTQQMSQLVGVTRQAGLHAIVYGERGVGKTSLAAVMHQILGAWKPPATSVRINCDGSDTFGSAWRKAFEELQFIARTPRFGFTDSQRDTIVSAADMLVDAPTPNEIKNILRLVTTVQSAAIFFDEFDRLGENGVKRLFADTIKTLSDNVVDATIVIVGVADTVDDLIAEHRSIERNVEQIPMPRMSSAELADVVNRGLVAVGMTIDGDSLDQITRLSQGLPHYTHLLAKAAALEASDDDRTTIGSDDVKAAVSRAIRDAQQTIISAYQRATTSSRETLYPQVVLAAALAKGDDLGYFASTDVREPLSRIMGRSMEIPAFSGHLNSLSSDRGPILQKTGTTRRFRFRFLNPLLQPYVVMRGLTEGLLDMATFERYA